MSWPGFSRVHTPPGLLGSFLWYRGSDSAGFPPALLTPLATTRLLGSWFGPEVALNWLFPSPLIIPRDHAHTRRDRTSHLRAEAGGAAPQQRLRAAPS
jgi:hypothetical protein